MSRFVPAANFDAVVAGAAEAGLVRVAREVVTVASRTVNDDTGAYDRSLRVEVDDRGVVAETTDPAGHIIEWGGGRQSPQAPLRTGAAAAGKFEPR